MFAQFLKCFHSKGQNVNAFLKVWVFKNCKSNTKIVDFFVPNHMNRAFSFFTDPTNHREHVLLFRQIHVFCIYTYALQLTMSNNTNFKYNNINSITESILSPFSLTYTNFILEMLAYLHPRCMTSHLSFLAGVICFSVNYIII